ncbi:MAG: hypothetical protein ACM3P1_03920 [Candidatus Saccharibacteria bacterium]
MKSITTFLVLFFMITISYGQTQYEKGYVIDKNNKRVECLIKNMDWKDNPTTITYKLTPTGAPVKRDATSIKEFAIGNILKYVGANVKVDLLNKPTVGTPSELDPVWTRTNLFLKVLLEGKATLYSYKNDKVERFFYSLNDSLINPLTYKQIHKASTLIKNNDFRQQLWDKLRLPNTTWEVTKTVNYTENELKNYFKIYNGNFPVPVVERINPQIKKLYLNLKLTPGVNFSSARMTILERDAHPELSFESKTGFRLGLEAELVIPFNNYRWGILFEPNYQSYSSSVNYGTKPTSLDYKSLELPIGVRYTIKVSDNSRVFLNGWYVPEMAMNSKVDYHSLGPNDKTIEINPASSWAIGGGLAHNNFSLEARYYTSKDLTKSPSATSDTYNRFAVILGYRFMSKNLKK